MFQEMINGTVAVLSRPSVSTFEEHEKDNLGWAVLYYVIAAVINGIITAITYPFTSARLQSQFAELPGGTAQAANPGIVGSVVGSIIGTLIILFLYLGLVYLIGRAFGGTGNFGELAYDIALFGAPLSVAANIVNIIPFVGWVLGLAIFVYNIYLTYLGIQSGMNLPKDKALYVILILAAIGIAIFLCIIVFFAAIIAAIIGASGGAR